jgi:uncharacterized sulfatase
VGKSQNRFGVESNGESLDGVNAELTIAERLKKVGYATGQIGKWHLGSTPEISSHGFDDVYAKNANRPGWANFNLDGKTVPGGPEKSKLYHLDACSEAALAMIAAMDDGVGAIAKELRERDLDKNTLIFYIGDNGAPLKIHKLAAPGGGPGWDRSLNEPMNG